MAKVYFFKDLDSLINFLDKIYVPKKRFPVKLHMGEVGNKFALSPTQIKPIIEALRAKGADPFLFDTIVAYDSIRATKEGYLNFALERGFDFCEVIIGNEGEVYEVGNHKFEVAREIVNSSFILVISHVKGHECSGFGGAIKNVGMGCVSKATKAYMHSICRPSWIREKCDLCGGCAEVCPNGNIEIDDEVKIGINCSGCGRCINACKKGALAGLDFQYLLALACKACLTGKECIFINFLTNITKYCDCYADPSPIICDDIGILLSDDIVAIDAASLNLIEKKCGRILEEVHGINPWKQVLYASQLGLGQIRYELVT